MRLTPGPLFILVLSFVLLCCPGCRSSQNPSPGSRAEELPTGQADNGHEGFALSTCKSSEIWALRGSAVDQLAIQLRKGDDAYELLREEL